MACDKGAQDFGSLFAELLGQVHALILATGCGRASGRDCRKHEPCRKKAGASTAQARQVPGGAQAMRTMLSYVYFGTNDLARATRFYDAVLAPLGMQRCRTGDAAWDRVAAGWGLYEHGLRELAFW